MNRFKIKAVCLILSLIMASGACLTACVGGEGDSTESGSRSETEAGSVTEDIGGSESESSSESGSESESDTDEEDTTEVGPKYEIEGDFGSSILEADSLKGSVKSYYESGDRKKLIVENGNVVIDLGMTKDSDGVMTVTGKDGGVFLDATADAYIKTEDGRYFYASNSLGGSDANIYRMGYYMYDVHVYGNDFFTTDSTVVSNEKKIAPNSVSSVAMVEQLDRNDGSIAFKVTNAADPRLYMKVKLNCSNAGYLRFSAKSDVSSHGELYICLEGMNGSFSSDMSVSFDLINDGQWHEYTVKLEDIPGYEGRVEYLRFDIGTQAGEVIELRDLVSFDMKVDVPAARFDRGLFVYPDKVNQVMHLIGTDDTENVSEYGFEMKIPADKVLRVLTTDRKGDHDTIDGVHWGTADYVGFDIDGVGIFGFIKINDDDYAGRLKVSLEDGYYVIRHFANPENGEIREGSDLYIGHRLYFGETHDFDELLFEAYCEHNPLSDITVTTTGSSPMGRFFSYDGLRGAYKYDVRYGNWYNIITNAQNMHYNVNTTINGDGADDRKIYIYTSAVANGQTLECAVLMDENDVLIPIPLEVCKNFAGDGEANEFLADEGYSEVYFPLVVGADDSLTFTMAHLYQNWGKVPLKQIDSIQFYTPFYHFSCGVTETNCLRPFYDMNAPKLTENIYCLPDHRAMSAPLWTEFKKNSRDPQHTNGGFHNMFEYVVDGEYVTHEFVGDKINSYGPTYAELVMDYITDDGKVKVSYTHMEMPHTDETRTFYVCTYEFLEDLTITDSKKNFSFYSVTGRYVDYGKMGYLNENNESVIVDHTLKGTAEYLMGDECPYFDLFMWMPTSSDPATENDYVNVSCLIYNYDIQMGGEGFDGGFAIYVQDGWAHLTLNADTLEFKKGDKISLNLVIVPWGSQQSDYTREDADWNVRQIRENTLLDPMTIEVLNGEAVESVFLPRVKSLDGKSAEFVLSGGENNVTVEVLGMTAIARPVVYELVDGEWIEYVISSKDTPDSRGNAHEYDGYMIRYDGDGTFSYSFVVDMNGDAVRTFKVVVE